MKDFDARVKEMREESRRSRRWFKAWFVFVLVVGVGVASARGYVAYQAGCFTSYFLHSVCLTEPAIDDAIRKVIK